MRRPYICVTCGTQFAEKGEPPIDCPICRDERQYVPGSGQRWTTLQEIQRNHHNAFASEAGVTAIVTEPKFAIGQRALLVAAPDGNVLWDCVPLLDRETIAEVRRHGGIRSIAISHPHYYSTMVDWSRAFDDTPIYLHADDQKWVMRPDRRIVLWSGEEQSIGRTLTLVRCGGHFDGATVLHRAAVADEPGILFSSDILTVTADRHVSFMRSYPNYLPLSANAVGKIAAAVEPLDFDRIYGAFPGAVILTGGKEIVSRSVQRYLRALEGQP